MLAARTGDVVMRTRSWVGMLNAAAWEEPIPFCLQACARADGKERRCGGKVLPGYGDHRHRPHARRR